MGKSTQANLGYLKLRDRIATGELGEGDRVTEASISKMLGIGRGPARETLLRLEADGLICRPGPRRARYVKAVEDQSLESIEHQYELREALDGLAARRAALRFSGQQILDLRKLVEQVGDALSKEDRQARVKLLHRFYSTLRQQCGNPLVAQALTHCHITTLSFHSKDRDDGIVRYLNDHYPMVAGLTAVVDAIDSHDPDHAEATMRRWTRASWKAVRFIMENDDLTTVTGESLSRS